MKIQNDVKEQVIKLAEAKLEEKTVIDSLGSYEKDMIGLAVKFSEVTMFDSIPIQCWEPIREAFVHSKIGIESVNAWSIRQIDDIIAEINDELKENVCESCLN